jgi:hypothetical protein
MSNCNCNKSAPTTALNNNLLTNLTNLKYPDFEWRVLRDTPIILGYMLLAFALISFITAIICMIPRNTKKIEWKPIYKYVQQW